MTYAIGIDIGGTKTAVGLVDRAGHVAAKTSLPTDASGPPADMVARMADAIHILMQERSATLADIDGIGVGAPGPLHSVSGTLTCPPNLPGWAGFPLISGIRRHFNVPITLENDATAATLAEKWIGAAQDSDHFIYITISTGIGAGIYMHGKLITGSTGNAGEVGHMVIDPSAGPCNCGQIGCWESVASGTAIARQASALIGRSISSREAFELAMQGDLQMQELMAKAFRYIALGCASLINIFDPEKIVIGGGVSQVGHALFQHIQDHVSQFVMNPAGRRTPVVPSALDQDAGLIGAAALVHMTQGGRTR